ncbi:hypothetical protein PIB30_109170, partial [Stylosanthes scabra]|nr:hypothetical protein [Stylosanthes scabra]
MYVRFHHVDRVKRQFGSEQPIPLDPVNLDGFLRASASDAPKSFRKSERPPASASDRI